MKWVILLFGLPATSLSMAQNPESEPVRVTEELMGFFDEDEDRAAHLENILQNRSELLDLNKATAEELRGLHIFSETQLTRFLRYREAYGPLASVLELQAIPDFDLSFVRRISDFLTVVDPRTTIGRTSLSRAWHTDNAYVIARSTIPIDKKSGFSSPDSSTRFPGPDGSWYLRFRNSKPGESSLGFTVERDAGEPFRWNPKRRMYGFDFHSAHLQLKNKGIVENLIFGDYTAQFGQGLLFGSAFGLGKGGETITTVRRPGTGFAPYTSSGEHSFYRGACGSFKISRSFFVSTMYSTVWRDASIDEHTATSLPKTGLHRTLRETETRKRLKETVYGAILNYRTGGFDGGLLFHHLLFSHKIDPNPTPYNQFAFRSRTCTNAGMYLNYTSYNFTFFAEAARTRDAGIATVAGFLGSLSSTWDVSVLFRIFGRNFHSFYSNAFSENSSPQNERGLYVGWKYHLSGNITIAGYTDLFRFPWLAFRRYAPSNGYEWLLKTSWQQGRNMQAFVQFREEVKHRNASIEGNNYELVLTRKRNLWFNFRSQANEKITLTTRVQYNVFHEGLQKTAGLVMAQDVSIRMGQFKVTVRHALVDAGDFDNRQYLYEHDAWMAFSMPVYYGVGVRNYALIEWKASRALRFWLRFSRQTFSDRETIGSGADAIEGNRKNDFKIQVMWRF